MADENESLWSLLVAKLEQRVASFQPPWQNNRNACEIQWHR
jgi:hypothetical protein